MYYSHSSSSTKKSSSRSYNSAAYSQRALIQQQKQAAKLAELQANQLEVKEYENYIELIQNVHRECEHPMYWNNIANSLEPYSKNDIGPEEHKAIEAYENFKPTFTEKIFKKNGERRKSELKNQIAEAKGKISTYTKAGKKALLLQKEYYPVTLMLTMRQLPHQILLKI